jgi:hypothetical protein
MSRFDWMVAGVFALVGGAVMFWMVGSWLIALAYVPSMFCLDAMTFAYINRRRARRLEQRVRDLTDRR